jgi:DNA transformation protein
MAVGAEFQAFVLDLLAPLGPGARRMFGGVGIMRDGLMFALLSNDTMYFRVDAHTRPSFQDAGCGPFRYDRAGRKVAIETYYAIPDGLYDEPEKLLAWARQALDAAHRSPRARQRRSAAR